MAERARRPSEQTVGQLLLQLCPMIGSRMRVKMEGIGLYRAQGFALLFLSHYEGVPQTEIARSMHLSPASVTSMLQRMERDGWVERRPDAVDQRVSRVYLTTRARALQEQAAATFHELEQEVTCALTTEEQSELRKLLLKVHARLLEHMTPGRHGFFPFPEASGEES
jgi:DNA-binding MarR family transcriptional regulator